jgi:hypothetical protein
MEHASGRDIGLVWFTANAGLAKILAPRVAVAAVWFGPKKLASPAHHALILCIFPPIVGKLGVNES